MAEEFITKTRKPSGIVYHPVDATEYILGAYGKPGVTVRTTGFNFDFPTGTSPRDYFRRIRPQEAVRLDELDAQIKKLHSEKKALLAEAWKKSHIVSLAELKRLAAEGGA